MAPPCILRIWLPGKCGKPQALPLSRGAWPEQVKEGLIAVHFLEGDRFYVRKRSARASASSGVIAGEDE
jgi:hypothetical protein